MKINQFLLIFSVVFFCLSTLFSCSPTKYIKPLDKDQHGATISFGGPLIKYGAGTIPIPFLVANYGYGIDSTLTGFASFNITSALFGNFQIELGATKQVLKQNKYIPAVSITPVANIIYRNKDAFKFYPQLAINAFWEYGKHKNMIYCGLDNWFELSQKRVYGVKQTNHLIFMPTIGHGFTGKKWNFNIETKIIAPNLSNEKLVVDYETPFKNQGAFGVYLGCTRKF
ncbi:MAG: hypothetical protein K8R85_03055 [Bacteroidetes bacterium]|nr:hypothetical protein [Bacteroidota bacterium]